MAELFKPVQTVQKVPFGVDPKTVLCIHFKAGNCERGAKCKFAHDMNVGRKVEKKDLYTDHRVDGKPISYYECCHILTTRNRYHGHLGSKET